MAVRSCPALGPKARRTHRGTPVFRNRYSMKVRYASRSPDGGTVALQAISRLIVPASQTPDHAMLGNSIVSLLAWAGQHPLFQATAVIFGTFILEDAATVLAAAQT